MKYQVKIYMDNDIRTVAADKGANLLKVLRNNGIFMDTPCGGKGTCGKCAVRAEGLTGVPSDREKKQLGKARVEKGYRLACNSFVESDLHLYLEETGGEAAIVTGGRMSEQPLEPFVEKRYAELAPPSLEDQTADLQRVLSAVGLHLNSQIIPTEGISLLSDISEIPKSLNYKVTAIGVNGALSAVEPGNTAGRLYGVAFDIGTTTVAAYLYDLNTGKLTFVDSMLNPQRSYGADVISRIHYEAQSKENKRSMQTLITGCINELTGQLVKKAGVELNDVYAAVFAGNTTMLHFLLGLDAAGIAVSPFIPVTTALLYFSPQALGLAMNKSGAAAIFPCVSAYIGGDTVAAILSSGMYKNDEISLLVDIGTNGEMVLGNKDWLLACSTAAGPAFEGANISSGMGGVNGAIDAVGPGPDFKYTVIGRKRPTGICGSGIIDIIARLLDAGIIDETGRMASADEAEEAGMDCAGRLRTVDGVRIFALTGFNGSGSDVQIAITQKDVREIQNAKAAIAAGIDTLIKHAGIGIGDVEKIYLAGGFGSSIHTDTAVKIGLLPESLKDGVKAIGNASGQGAVAGLLSQSMLALSEKIGQRVKYIELSASAYFTEKYVEHMLY